MKKQSRLTNTERLTLRVSADLMNRAREKAREYGLSISAFVRMLISKEISKK